MADRGGEDLLERFCRTALYVGIHGTSTMVIRTVTQKLAGYYRPELPSSDDHEMWMRIVRMGHAAETDIIQGIKRGLTNRQGASSLVGITRHGYSTTKPHSKASSRTRVGCCRKRHVCTDSLGAVSGARGYWSALAHLCRGQASMSRDLLKFAIRLYPTTAIVSPLHYLLPREDAARHVLSVVPDLVITAYHQEQKIRDPIDMGVRTWHRPVDAALPARIKTGTNYQAGRLARIEGRARGCQDGHPQSVGARRRGDGSLHSHGA
jgi:hypothetical protein